GYLTEIQNLFPEAQIRPGLESVVITFEDIADYVQKVKSAFPTSASGKAFGTGKQLKIPVEYSGEDLAQAATATEISVDELIKVHQETIWQVALIGFAPGFPYLLPKTNQDLFKMIGRLASPRAKVPAGSVGLAAGMSCIYPQASPGGWHLIGITNTLLFDSAKEKPSLLDIGDEVSFEAIS
ncbi:MAG: hypothetical protein RLZZ556_400, partial [Actinomycetota bacterium]